MLWFRQYTPHSFETDMTAAVVCPENNFVDEVEPESPRSALIVDEAADDRCQVSRLVERMTDLLTSSASNTAEALKLIENEAPAIVLTGVRVPGMEGLELVTTLKARHPSIPVIILTAGGSEEAAAEAMRGGAASFIPKRCIREELPQVLAQVLAAARTDRRRYELMSSTTRLNCEYELASDPTLVPVLVGYLQEHCERMGLCDRNGRIRLGVALEEALLNGVYHGNLEVSSSLKQDGDDVFNRLAAQRRRQEPYCRRRLHVHVRLDAEQAVFVIRDEGPGFDLSTVPDPTDPENLLRPSGRGLLLIRMFMDDIKYNDAGNELTMTKWRPQ
jgi:CheY-like chemotaxis protein